MAGGGAAAAASALSSPWRALLQRALDANAHLRHSTYFQLNREKAWFASSVRSRLQYLGPQPGVPIIDEEQVKDVRLDPSAVPVEAFCLLVLDPEKVDYLNLKNNQRLIFTRSQKEDGSIDWMAEKVTP